MSSLFQWRRAVILLDTKFSRKLLFSFSFIFFSFSWFLGVFQCSDSCFTQWCLGIPSLENQKACVWFIKTWKGVKKPQTTLPLKKNPHPTSTFYNGAFIKKIRTLKILVGLWRGRNEIWNPQISGEHYYNRKYSNCLLEPCLINRNT